MLFSCSAKISRIKDAVILELWPFSARDVADLFQLQRQTNAVFVAVRGKRWPDGFHPPTAKLISAKVCSNGLIGYFGDKSQWQNALRQPNSASIVDIKAFIPRRRIQTETDLKSFERYFVAFDEVAALRRWGGYWVHVHDGCKTYIQAPSDDPLRALFANVMRLGGGDLDQEEIENLFKSLISLRSSKCLLLWWFKHFVYHRIANADIHNYEQIQELIAK